MVSCSKCSNERSSAKAGIQQSQRLGATKAEFREQRRTHHERTREIYVHDRKRDEHRADRGMPHSVLNGFANGGEQARSSLTGRSAACNGNQRQHGNGDKKAGSAQTKSSGQPGSAYDHARSGGSDETS